VSTAKVRKDAVRRQSILNTKRVVQVLLRVARRSIIAMAAPRDHRRGGGACVCVNLGSVKGEGAGVLGTPAAIITSAFGLFILELRPVAF